MIVVVLLWEQTINHGNSSKTFKQTMGSFIFLNSKCRLKDLFFKPLLIFIKRPPFFIEIITFL